MALIGNLKEIKLPSLIQLNCMERNNAKLTIEHGGKFGFIYFENGQVTHAEFDPFIGEDAVYRLLELFEGKFKVENYVRPPAKTIQTNWSNLLLAGMHKLDHRQDKLENRYFKLFERILTIKGVLAVSLVNKSGVCLDRTSAITKQNTIKESNSAFIMLQAENMSKLLGRNRPGYLSILSGDQRYLLVNFNEHFIMIQMEKKIKSDSVLPLIRQAIGEVNRG